MDRLAIFYYEASSQGMPFVIHTAVMDDQMPIRGTNRSHRMIVQLARDSGWPEVWIGEDDMKFFDRGAFDHFYSNKPKDFDLYLSGIFHGDIEEDGTVKDFSGMTLYCVHRRFYEKFLQVNPHDNIDRALAGLGKYVVCDPIVTTQYGGFSDNKKTFVRDYEKYLEGRRIFKR